MAGQYLEPALRSASLAGGSVAWREAGEGTGLPLVLLHGIGSNARAWAGQFAAFASERRVIAWNAPGYAGSDPLPADWPLPHDYAATLAGLLDHLGVARCVLVGQSLGAVMATAFALAAPQRVAELVLASPAGGYRTPRGEPLPETVATRIADVGRMGPVAMAEARYARLLTDRASPDAHAIVRQAMAEIVPHGYAQAARLLAGADLPAAVAGLRVPTTVMWGARDVVTPPDACRRVAEAVPGGRVEIVPEGGHAFAIEIPDPFNQAVGEVLARADARVEVLAWT